MTDFAADWSENPGMRRAMQQRSIDILGVPISVVNMSSAVDSICRWIEAGDNRYVCATDMHSVMQAQVNPEHMTALSKAAMVVPDGMPIVWVSRTRGEATIERVSGPDLMLPVCRMAAQNGWRQYFYGGAEGVAEAVGQNLARRFPGTVIAGTQCPPFRELSAFETEAAIDEIVASKPDVIWVGLGCPKQEIWMSRNIERLNGAVAIGVGAAFDFHSGRIPRAPAWMRKIGLEWLFRLSSEPGRLWRRYLLMGPRFIMKAAMETWRLRNQF